MGEATVNLITPGTGETPVSRGGVFLTVGASAVASGLCWLSAGNSLGLYFGPLFMLAIALPPMAIGCTRRMAFLRWAAGTVPVIVMWLIASRSGWVGSSLVLLSFGLAITMLARLVRSSSIVIILALAWLTWPVWLSQGLHASWMPVDRLVSLHPLMAINRQVQFLGIWSEQPLAYELTNLGQDVQYALPGILPTVLFHAVIAGIALLCSPLPSALQFRANKKKAATETA